MARINDELVVQLVADDLVIVDGAMQEIRVPFEDVIPFLAACDYLHRHASLYDPKAAAQELAEIRAVEQKVEQAIEQAIEQATDNRREQS